MTEPVTTGTPVQRLELPAPWIEWVSLKIEVAEPSPGSRTCYNATSGSWGKP